MAGIIKGSINLSTIPKDKIIEGKKGKYLPITITVNDETDNYGQQGPIIVSQTKEERESKEAKTYLGNVQVVWTNGTFPEPAPRDGQNNNPNPASKSQPNPVNSLQADDLPF
jgi:hypothetical protein